MFKKTRPQGPYDCPAAGFRERCRKELCPEWVTLNFVHPQTGEPFSDAGCARGLTPILLVKLAQEVRQSAAAVESARNEARKDTAAMAGAMSAVADELGAIGRELARPPLMRGVDSIDGGPRLDHDRRDRGLDLGAAARFLKNNGGG